jgi:predicted dehydrogenase
MRPLKWGLIGAGDIARKRVAPALRDVGTSELVAVSRARSGLAESFAREFGAPRWYPDWRELLGDPEVEAVYIATPVHVHAEQSIAAAEAGKHVLCEKPMAMDVAGCDDMIAACRAHRVTLGIAYYRRFYPSVSRIKGLLESGEIGDVVLAQINAFERFNPPADHPRAWLLQKDRSGGGPMFDFGCHRLEILLNLLGPVRRLTSLIANVVFHRDVEDTAAALLQFESGACASLTVSHAAVEPQDTLDIFGATGSIHVAALTQGDVRIVGSGGERVESHPAHANVHVPLVEDFADAVRSGRDPAVTGDIGRAVARLESEIYTCG